MIKSIRDWLNNIPIDDHIERQQAALLQIFLLSIIAILSLAILLLLILEAPLDIKIENFVNNLIAIGVILIPTILIRRGHLRQGALVATVLLTLGIGIAVIIEELTATTTLFFTLPITLAGLVLGRRYLIGAITASIIIIIIRLFLLPVSVGGIDATGEAGTYILLVSMLGVFLDRFGIVLREALIKANRSNEELESLVSQRTIELKKANMELKTLAQMKEEFVANVSHELRTPVTSLKLYHQLLAEKPEKQVVYMASLQRETERLGILIESLLDVSSLSQGQIAFNPHPIDLNALAKDYAIDRRLEAERRELSLTFNQSPAPLMIQADDHYLGQVLSIFLTNALNYTPKGGQVTISTRTRHIKSKRWAGISVLDTGPGISPHEQAELFTRFFRGKAGQESEVSGTGLGLSIASEIVERHHGQIEVESTGVPGAGVEFFAWFPLIK